MPGGEKDGPEEGEKNPGRAATSLPPTSRAYRPILNILILLHNDNIPLPFFR